MRLQMVCAVVSQHVLRPVGHRLPWTDRTVVEAARQVHGVFFEPETKTKILFLSKFYSTAVSHIFSVFSFSTTDERVREPTRRTFSTLVFTHGFITILLLCLQRDLYFSFYQAYSVSRKKNKRKTICTFCIPKL